jgi:hypothetical protein
LGSSKQPPRASFDELVPPEVRPTLHRAHEALSGLDIGIAWALALGVPLDMLSGIEAKLRAQHARDRAHVAELLAAYRRGDVTGEEFARWVEVNLDPDRMIERAGIGTRSSVPPAAA